MTIVELIRLEEDETHGTFGTLKIDKRLFCWTLEPADLENAPSVSSIPAQQYMCKRHNSPKYGITYQVTNVPGRTHILFHPGNTDDDTKGCILLGETLGKLRGDRAVLNSGKTFKRFMDELYGTLEFHLTIQEHY